MFILLIASLPVKIPILITRFERIEQNQIKDERNDH